MIHQMLVLLKYDSIIIASHNVLKFRETNTRASPEAVLLPAQRSNRSHLEETLLLNTKRGRVTLDDNENSSFPSFKEQQTNQC